jgi:hypothetical protein
MLANLCDIVAKGTRTSSGFKKCHYVACAKALNDHFHLSLTNIQISNHNRTWRRKYQKIVKLKQLSGAGWDEEKFMIVLGHEHYTNHIYAFYAYILAAISLHMHVYCWNLFAYVYMLLK